MNLKKSLLNFLITPQLFRSNKLDVVEKDPDDNKIIECATIGDATHIVTGDKKHLLPMETYQQILIVNATNFLQANFPNFI